MNLAIHPTLGYRDARAAVDFLINTLGFAEVVIHHRSDGTISQAVLRWPTGDIITAYDAAPNESALTDLAPKDAATAAHLPFGIFIRVDDPDAVHDRVIAAGASIVRPLEDSFRGDRGFTVRDPEGLCWSVGTYAGD